MLLGAAVFGLLARPARYVVEGVSMTSRFLPGDVVATGWLPVLDRFRSPGRFECWIVSLTAGTAAVKRVVGLPGESVSLTDGDLVVDGRVVLKSPRILAEVGSLLGQEEPSGPDLKSGAAPRWLWTQPAREVLDDAHVTETQSRLLLPVRDVGVAAIVHLHRQPAPGACRVRIRVGSRAVSWRLTAAGRHALVAGRLDGHLVAAAWPLPAGASAGPAARSCIPAGAPGRWQVKVPWPSPTDESVADEASPPLAIGVEAGDDAVGIEHVTTWRDVLHRPATPGTTAWQLGPGELLVLGDFPSGSSDSRQWGPVPRQSLRHRVWGR